MPPSCAGADEAARQAAVAVGRVVRGCGQKPTRHLKARSLSLGFPDQARGTIAVDLLQLILINDNVAAAAYRTRSPPKREQHGEDRRGGHQCKNDPQDHGAISKSRVGRSPQRSGAPSRPAPLHHHGVIAAAMGAPARQLRAVTQWLGGIIRLRAGRLALGRRGLHRDFGRFGQQTRIIGTEYDPAEANRRIHLRLPERPVGVAGMAEGIKQHLGPAFEVVLQLGVAAHGCFVDGELVGVVPAGANEFDQQLGFAHIHGVEY